MPKSSSPQDQEAPFISHLLELRDRLLKSVAAVLVIFVACAPFANQLYLYLAEPLMSALGIRRVIDKQHTELRLGGRHRRQYTYAPAWTSN